MEDAPQVRAATAFGVPRHASIGLPATLPAVILILGVLSALAFFASLTSTAWYDDSYQLVLYPPSADAYTSFFEFGSGLLVRSIALVLPPLLLAAVPASFGGAFLALVAPRWLRRTGVFLLLAAWALTYERNVGMIHLFPGSSTASWIPWMAYNFPGAPFVFILYASMPIIALAVYSALRGDFFGLVWMPAARPRGVGLEAVPRACIGAAFGILIAGAFAIVDPIIGSFASQTELGVGRYLYEQMSIIGGVPHAAATSVVLLTVFVAAFLGFVGIQLLIRLALRVAAGTLPHQVRAGPSRVVGDVLGGVGFAFLVVSAYVPLGLAILFSLNSQDDVASFGGWSPRWYVGAPEGDGILSYPGFLASFRDAIGFSASVALLVTAFAVLAAIGVWNLPPRTRGFVRGILYAGFVIPLGLLSVMTLFARWVASGSIVAIPPEPPWDAVPVALAQLPLGLAVAFVVASASSTWRHAWTVGGRWLVWLRPAAAAFLATFAFLISSLAAFGPYSVTTLLSGLLTKKIFTPLLDAGIVLLSIASLVPIAVAFLLVRNDDGEVFRL